MINLDDIYHEIEVKNLKTCVKFYAETLSVTFWARHQAVYCYAFLICF